MTEKQKPEEEVRKATADDRVDDLRRVEGPFDLRRHVLGATSARVGEEIPHGEPEWSMGARHARECTGAKVISRALPGRQPSVSSDIGRLLAWWSSARADRT